jgi:hypothetical protein
MGFAELMTMQNQSGKQVWSLARRRPGEGIDALA